MSFGIRSAHPSVYHAKRKNAIGISEAKKRVVLAEHNASKKIGAVLVHSPLGGKKRTLYL